MRFTYLLICVVLCTVPLVAAQVEVLGLDLEQRRGSELRFDKDALHIGDERLPYQEVFRVVQFGKVVSWNDYDRGILLQDGSWLPVASLNAAEQSDVVQAITPFGNLDIPLELIAAWGDYHLLPKSVEHDRLLLKNNNQPFGELFGFEEGRLLLQTDLSDDPLEVPLAQIQALRLRQQKSPVLGLHAMLKTHPQRPPLKILLGEQPRLAISKQIALDDWASCQDLQIVGARTVLLGDVEPSNVIEKGMFGKVWPYAVNANIDGSPIVLNEKRYEYGVVLHSYAKISWPLPANADRFRAVIGISDQLGREGNCIVRIRGDEKLLWSKNGLRGGHKAHEVDLDIQDFKELHIEVDYGERYDIGDHVVFADAYILKSKN